MCGKIKFEAKIYGNIEDHVEEILKLKMTLP